MNVEEYEVSTKTPLCPIPNEKCPLYRTQQGFCISKNGPKNCGAYHQAKISEKADLFRS